MIAALLREIDVRRARGPAEGHRVVLVGDQMRRGAVARGKRAQRRVGVEEDARRLVRAPGEDQELREEGPASRSAATGPSTTLALPSVPERLGQSRWKKCSKDCAAGLTLAPGGTAAPEPR